MRSGDLDKKIEFESPQSVNDGGDLIESWVTAGEDWAYILSQRGGESFEAARQNARELIRVKIRFRDDLKVTWRMKWLDQTYYIKSIDRTGVRKGELWFTAEVSGAA